MFGTSTTLSFKEDETAPPEGGGPEGNQAPIPLDNTDATTEAALHALSETATEQEISNLLILGCIASASATNFANYGASFETIFRQYLYNIQEIFMLHRDGELYDENHKPHRVTRAEKLIYFVQIVGYALGWTTVFVFTFIFTFGLAGLAVLPFLLLSMGLASKFVIDAHINRLTEKALDSLSGLLTPLKILSLFSKA